MDTNVESPREAPDPAQNGDEAIGRALELANEWREAAASTHGAGERASALLECARAVEREFGMLQRVVGIYMVDRAPGGPEEGGWFYDVGERYTAFDPIVCRGNAQCRTAHALAEKYIEDHRMNVGRHDPSSVLCEGWYASWAFDGSVAPEHFPATIPHYE